MSLILEALRKSERERRLGSAPSIGSPVMSVRRRRNWLPLLVVLISLGLLALWWLQRKPQAPPAPPNPVATAKPGAAPAARNPAEFEALPAQGTQPIQTNRRIETRPNPPTQAAPTTPATPPAAVAANPDVAATTPASVAPATARSGTGRMPVQIEPAPATSTAVVAQQPAADAPATPTPRDAAATAPAQPVESLAMVWELPLATRRELPAIAISMHVFAENPAQRFIILNGQRQVQGDDIGGLKLVEIRKDGAVFEFSGQRFLYPRGGR